MGVVSFPCECIWVDSGVVGRMVADSIALTVIWFGGSAEWNCGIEISVGPGVGQPIPQAV
jgi:hypothetical protein